jgi:ketosteroid isomerase-like protein
VQEIVDRETRAWDTGDVELLLSVFHPDMVWPWPSSEDAHDPADWRLVLGRFDAARWRRTFQSLFDGWQLLHNRRRTVKIEISDEKDGAFAVVDIDTAWRKRGGEEEMRWLGRVCKVYALVRGEWKMTMHTGVPRYANDVTSAAHTWAEVWQRAWPAADVDALDALYADEAVFYSHPFRKRQAAREYVSWAFGEQASAECRFGEPVVQGDRAAVDWWGAITAPDGSVETIAGTSLLRFSADGLVVEQRDVWAAAEGRVELPPWARPAGAATIPAP